MNDKLRPGMIIPLTDDPTRNVKLIVRQQTRLDSIWWAVYLDTGKTVSVKVADGKAKIIT